VGEGRVAPQSIASGPHHDDGPKHETKERPNIVFGVHVACGGDWRRRLNENLAREQVNKNRHLIQQREFSILPHCVLRRRVLVNLNDFAVSHSWGAGGAAQRRSLSSF
jgi:hypothetical protein